MEDILQKAILDVNRMHEVAMKAAEKSVYHKFSKEVKKNYIENLTEMNDNFEVDDQLLSEFDLGSLDDGEQNPDLEMQADPQSNSAGAEAGGAVDGSMPLEGGQQPGTEENGGIAPQEPQSEVVNEVPDSFEDGTGSVVITFDLDADESANFDSDASLAHEDANNLLTAGNTVQTEPQGQDLQQPDVAAPQTSIPPIQEEDEDNDDIFSDEFKSNPFGEGMFKISDDILLEYIEKSVQNDKRIDLLSETIQSLQEMVEKLSLQLESSTKNVENLKEQNIRLMYKNQALNDVSLSEHQKSNIVKALDKAKTLNEAKTIYETVKTSNSKVVSKDDTINKILTPNTGKKFINENKKVIRNDENNEKIPPILEKLYNSWGIK